MGKLASNIANIERADGYVDSPWYILFSLLSYLCIDIFLFTFIWISTNRFLNQIESERGGQQQRQQHQQQKQEASTLQLNADHNQSKHVSSSQQQNQLSSTSQLSQKHHQESTLLPRQPLSLALSEQEEDDNDDSNDAFVDAVEDIADCPGWTDLERKKPQIRSFETMQQWITNMFRHLH